ncbi:H-NS-like global regulator TsrA [Aliivibrio wodanis]|uniref:H-NS-like global regulator TsrA n=1 Tax=Aliivibrio wodanis TaxID=80852 RepID=UPI00406C39FC
MSMSIIEMARVLEQMEESPEKLMFGKLLSELGNQSQERVRSAARQVSVPTLRDLIYQFQVVIEERKGETTKKLAEEMAKEGVSLDDFQAYLASK